MEERKKEIVEKELLNYNQASPYDRGYQSHSAIYCHYAITIFSRMSDTALFDIPNM